MIEYRSGEDRFVTREAGRTTSHSFSFGAHYDARNVGFGNLVAHNDEHLPEGTGYADHPHTDLEILTWVLEGSLRHHSDVGSGVISAGSAQRLSAGSGVVHAETAEGGATRFLQAWVRPDEPGLVPSYAAAKVGLSGGWTCVADGDGKGLLPIAARGTSLHVADLAAGDRLALPDAPLLHVFLSRGRTQLGERMLVPDDAARLRDEGGRDVVAEEPSQLFVWALRSR